jgi:hypothetical protein
LHDDDVARGGTTPALSAARRGEADLGSRGARGNVPCHAILLKYSVV